MFVVVGVIVVVVGCLSVGCGWLWFCSMFLVVGYWLLVGGCFGLLVVVCCCFDLLLFVDDAFVLLFSCLVASGSRRCLLSVVGVAR